MLKHIVVLNPSFVDAFPSSQTGIELKQINVVQEDKQQFTYQLLPNVMQTLNLCFLL